MFSKNLRKTLTITVITLTALLIGGTATEAATSPITVSGIVKDWNGGLITTPVDVTLVGDPTKATTTSITDGSFTLPGVPANTPFSLKFSAVDYLDVYSTNVSLGGDYNLNVSGTGSTFFSMPTTADLTALGAIPAAGKGLIAGRVADATYHNSTVGGVFVTATGNGGKVYPVLYAPFGGLVQGGTTSSSGRYYVLDVDDGDTVTLSASRSGWSFSPLTFNTHANGVSMGRIYGMGPGYATMSGSVVNTTAAGIPGARLELNGDNGKFTDAGGDGSYTFSGLQRDANFYNKVTATDYVPVYAGPVNLSGNISGINIMLFTAAEMSGYGVTGSNGMLTCKVIDPSMIPLSGATVLLTSKKQASYNVVYSGGGSATNGTGSFVVPNILPGDVVKVEVTKAGYAFPPAYLDGFTSAVTGRYIAGAVPVAYNSFISDQNTAGIAGATIEQVGASPANTATSSPSPAGAYTLNVPSGVSFYLKFSEAGAGYADTYTAEMTRTAPVNESLSDGNNLFPVTRLGTGAGNWNVASGKGIIRSRVKDSSGNYIAGATVIYTSSQGRTYTVCYDNACSSTLTSTPGSDGRYMIKDVEPGDTVTVTAKKTGYTFNTRVFHTYADSVHQGGITGTAASVSGTISYSGGQTGNFKLKLWSADMTGSYYQELSLTGGSFAFNNVPTGRYFLSAYRDGDYNGQYTAGEAYGYHQDAGGLKVINVNGSSVTIGAVTLADPSAGPTGASVSINAAIGDVRGYLIFFRSGDFLTNNLQNAINPAFTLDVDLTAGSHTYPVTQMQHDYTGMPVPAGNYDFYFMTGDLERGPDKGVVQYMQPGVVIGKGAVTAIPVSGSIPFNAGGSVSGTVTSIYSTHPLDRVSVYLADSTGQIKAWGRTDASGYFQFDHVPADTYYLQLAYAGYNVFSPISVTVTDGGTWIIPGTDTVLTPTQTPATISGTLIPFGSGVDSRILLKQGETLIANVAPSATDGSYTISDVVSGSYTLIGSARGYTPGQVPVGVTAAGQALTQNFTLNGTTNVIKDGLDWLLAHQRADGSFDDNLSGNADQFVFGWTGYTGLTLLAILENPKYNVSTSPDYLGVPRLGQIHDALYGVTGATPKNGIKQYFESTYHAADDPSTGWNDIGALYNSTILWSSVAATPVALEKLIALGMPLSDPKVTGAVQFLLGAQITAAKASNPIFAGGWRYNPGNTDTDNWETAWVIMALMKAGLNPSVQAVVDGLAHIRRSQITEGGGAGLFAYQPNDTSGYGPLGTSAACVLALNFAGAPNSDPDVNRFFQWVKNNGGFSGYDRWADAYWWSMFPWAAILYNDPATSGPVKKYYETLELTWKMADDIILRQNPDGSWNNPNYIIGGSNSGNTVMYTASALMAIAPYAGLTPLPDETTISGTVRNPSGVGLQNAKVDVLLDGVVRASTVTNGSGAYTLNVPQNYAYTIRVTAAGFVRILLTTANVGTGGLPGQDIAYLTSDTDTAAPTITGLAPTNGSTVGGSRPGISAMLADLGSGGNAPSGIDPATISMKLDGNTVNASYNISTGVVSFTPQYDLPYAPHTVTVDVKDFAGNAAAQASWSFTVGSTIPFDGKVTDKDGNAIEGATIEALGVTGVSSVTSRADGTFTLTGIPAGQDFHLWITPPAGMTGYLPTYSSLGSYTVSSNRVARPFILHASDEVSEWGVPAGMGVLAARALDDRNPRAGLAGVVITAQGSSKTYPVTYRDDAGAFGGQSTYGNGEYYVLNVDPNDTVIVTAQKDSWIFPARVYVTHADAVGQGNSSIGVRSMAGNWGLINLEKQDGQDYWASGARRYVFNADGTGTITGNVNSNGTITNPAENPFTYTLSLNADGSYALPITVNQTIRDYRIAFSDNGNMAVMDGTTRAGWLRLMTLIKINTNKTYGNADVSGEYYNLGFERNTTGVADPPNGNGSFMAISGVHTFNGAGTYSYSGKANSVKLDGSNYIWDDPGKTDQTYTVNADGSFIGGGGAFLGWLTGNGIAFSGGGDFQNGVNNQVGYFFMKKADRTYQQTDLAGKWALVSFGQDSQAGAPVSFDTQIGTMECSTVGVCSFKLRDRRSDGSSNISTGSLTLSVAGDGSFGGSLPGGGAPAYAGAIGNNGNTILFNGSFEPDKAWHREIFIGVRANAIGDLAGNMVQVTTFSNEAAFTAAASSSTLINFDDRNTSGGRVSFVGNEYAASGVTFSSPNAQPLWVYPPPTSIWTWPSNYLSPGNEPFGGGGDSNEDSLTLTFNPPVAAVGWTFLDMPNPSAVTIRVYDQSNALIHEALNGMGIVVGVASNGFWGILSPMAPIARVEIIDTANNADDVAYDNFRFAATYSPPWAGSFHNQNDGQYYGDFGVSDPTHIIQSVTVTGDGINGTLSLTYRQDAGQWWTPQQINYGANPPVNAQYQIVVTGLAGSQTYSRTIDGGVADFATGLAPTGAVAGVLTFSFTGITGANYAVHLFDANWMHVWMSPTSSSTTVTYTGPTLPAGTYNYLVHSFIGNNTSVAQGQQFTYLPIPYTPMVYNVHSSSGYNTYLDVAIGPNFPGTLPDAITAINVTGPGGTVIATKPDFGYDPMWRSFTATKLPGPPALGEYRFEVSGLSMTTVITDSQVTNRTIPVPDKATFSYTYTPGQGPTFNWGAVDYAEVSLYYRLVINDMAGIRIYNSPRVQGMLSHTVPVGTLQPDQTYKVQVRVEDALGGDLQNQSRSDYVTFRLNPVSFTGYVMDTASPNNPISGATIEQAGAVPPNVTTSIADGSYTLTGLPAGTPFHLKFTKDGFAPTYSANMASTMNIMDTPDQSFNLFPANQLATWGIDPGKGVIRTRVRDEARNYIGGVVISATSQLGQTYQICYDDGCSALTATSENSGRFIVRNVLPGDTVTVTAAKAGWTFNNRIYHTYADSIHQGGITGIAITVSGIVKDWSGNVIPSPGVTVTLVGDEAKTTTTSTTDGSFSLLGVPANTPFSLKFSAAGYLDVYSPNVSSGVDINLNVSSTGSTPFNMPTAADLTAFGAMPAAGTGLMAGRVADATYRYSSTVGGVFVTATGNGGKVYPVFYRDPFGVLVQGGTTSGNGRYYVLDVDGGDTVTLSASKSGWSFSPMTFNTHADGMSSGRITGPAPGYVTMSGLVVDTAGAGIPGAKLEMNGDNGKFTNAGSDGSYNFSGLPRDTYFYSRVTASGYVPVYAGPVNLSGNISGINITLFTAAEMLVYGVTGSNGMLTCKVIDPSMTPLSGATVLLTSKNQASYNTVYIGGSSTTNGTGSFVVPNIQPGDTVKVDVTKAGYAFAPTYLDGFTSAVTGKYIVGAPPVAYNSYVADSANPPAGIAGATIEQVGASPANSTTSSTSPAGAYTLNVPSGVPFYLKFSKAGAGYADTYTAEMTRNAPFSEGLIDGNNLFAVTKLTDWNVASGRGIIRARVKDSSGNNIAGATVVYTSSQGRTYTICYDDACTPGLTETQISNGRYMIKDVEAGDTVTATARKTGYTFNTRVFHTYADSVHQGGITGTELYSTWAGSHHNQDGQYVGEFAVSDPTHVLQSVAVTGNNISGTLYLTYHQEGGAWWATPNEIHYGATPPVNAQYQIVATGPAGTYTYYHTLNGGVADFATGLAPTGNVTGALTFTFTGITGANYSVNLYDANWLLVWTSPTSPATTVSYTGPFLPAGTYNYQVRSWIGSNDSIAQDQFTYTPGISYTAMVYNVHSSSGYNTYLDVAIGPDFPSTLPDAITSINVTGPGGTVIATKPNFSYDPMFRSFLAKLPGQPALGEYRFEVSGLSMTTVITDSQVTNRTIPVPDKSTFDYTYAPGVTPTFSWGAVNYTETPLYYRLIINDMAGNRVYSTSRVQGMFSHTVPAGTLQAEQSYQFQVRVDDASSGNLLQNESRSDYVTFSLTPISFTGYVVDSQSPSQIVAGATVEQGGVPTNFAATDATGLYTLGNLKAGLPFYLKIYKDASYAPCYSGEMSFTADRVEPRDRAFTLFPASRLGPGTGNWNVDAGKGIIRAHVRDKIDGYVGGAVVTATGVLQPTYAVCYDDDCTSTLTATKDKDGAGRFVIKNVLNGDTVTVTVTKSGWTSSSRVYHTVADSVSQGRITIQGPVSLAVTAVTNTNGSPTQGVQLQVVGFPSVSAITGTDGTATLAGLPPNTTIPFSLSKAGNVSSYGQFSVASGVSSWKVPIFTLTDLTTWGIQSGKGVIYGRLMDNANPDDNTNSLAGVQVNYESAQGKSYDVVYLNSDWTVASGATATLSSGRYLILNVSPEDTVTVSARKAGWSFWSNTVRCYADGVNYGYMHGTAGGATVTMYVKDKNGAAIAGATVRMAENTEFTATSDGNGKATLTNLPLDTPLTFEVMKTGYANAYSRHVTLTGNNNDWGTYYLFPSVNAVWGVLEGKGAVMGWVKNEADGSTLAGAQVTCASIGGRKYAVAYLNSDYSIAAGAAATSSNGRFLILDVEPGDTVVATAQLTGWTFQPRAYTTRANAVNQSNINGRQYKYQGTARLLHGMAPMNYLTYLRVDDPPATIASITVTGPGIASPISLAFDSRQKSWLSGGGIGFDVMPSLPLTYALVITERGVATPLKQYLYVTRTGVRGDVNGDGLVNLTDALLSLQASLGNLPAGATVYNDADVDGDGRIGLPEALYILQTLSGLR